MKRVSLFILTTLMLAACSPQNTTTKKSSTTTNNNNVDGSGGSTTGSSGGGSTTGSSGGGSTTGSGGSGSTCSGTSSDGTGPGYPISSLDLTLAGGQAWLPGNYSEPLAQATMITVQEGVYLFQSDARVRVRFKVHDQPIAPVGQEYCHGRKTGQAGDQYNYTKLKFRVHLRDVYCSQVNANNQCTGTLSLGSRYKTQYIGPVNVNSCSNIIDIGSLRNPSGFATVVEVEDVNADSTCQANSTYCPAEKKVRDASCWRMTMQIVTDYTQDFK
jgi:hypothetical protein